MTLSEVGGHISAREREELGYWASRAEAGRALEVGHWKGRSTIVLLDSLPDDSVLISVDHHNGDAWVDACDRTEYEDNVAPHVGRVRLVNRYEDFRTAVRDYHGFTFVFYDADHSVEAARDFWSLVRGRLVPGCIVCFDDADWDGGQELTRLAGRSGYEDVTRWPIQRLGGDKANGSTHTLRVMRHDS